MLVFFLFGGPGGKGGVGGKGSGGKTEGDLGLCLVEFCFFS